MAKFRLYGSRTKEESQRERDHRALSRRVAAEGMVLLKNDNILPLHEKAVALYGAGARQTVRGGTGSGDMHERFSVSIEQGLKNAGFQIASTRWLDRFDLQFSADKEAWRQAIEERIKRYPPWRVQQMFDEVIHVTPLKFPTGDRIQPEDLTPETDTAIYVLARQAGESTDRRLVPGDFLLSEVEFDNLRTLAEHYQKFLLVINSGGIVDLRCLDEIQGIGGVLYFAQGGEEGGNAFADLVSGKVCPSGKLTDTWGKRYEDYPSAADFSYLNGNLQDEDYKEGIYVGYRHFDSFGIEPRFPFGFGLSYTTFSHHVTQVDKHGTGFSVQAEVVNTGAEFAGKEILQLFVAKPNGSLCREMRSLVAFAKTDLLALGESEMLTLSFDLHDLASYNEGRSAWILEMGEYGIYLGSSSRDLTPIAVVSLDEDAVTEQCTPICPRRSPLEEQKARIPAEVYPGHLPRFTLRTSEITCVTHCYETPGIQEHPLLSSLNDQELVELCVGGGFPMSSYNITPGSAGRTSTHLLKKGIPNVNFSDGPAGLNLTPQIVILRNGSPRYLEGVPETWKWGWIKKFEPLLRARPGKGRPVYQFMTAWPCTTLQAQTWNEALIEEVGRAIGVEMLEVGVTLWLAPAMNIHRNPLCGRNFEYYSEDPLVSGRMAAAVTKGVQSHPGIGVTLKHFCCNNQEDNREHVSSNVSERALREIYLRGFRYAVAQAKPWAVMTSYNKVNGTYTPNSHDLCTKVLRNEWGFEGMVMTDWGATGDGKGSHELCPAAGNDLIMPGNKAARKALLGALKEGHLEKEDLHRCAANVLQVILSSAVVDGFQIPQPDHR
jgi:beta-glucosidase